MVKKEQGVDSFVCPECKQPVTAEVKRHKTLGVYVPVWGPGACHNAKCSEYVPAPRHRPEPHAHA